MFEAAADTEAPQRDPSSENHKGSRLESLHVDCNNRFEFRKRLILAVARCKNSGVQNGEQIGFRLARLPKLNLFGIRMLRRRLLELQKPAKQEDEEGVEKRRHALAQKLIAKTLKQADRRPRRTRLKIATFYRIGLRIVFRTRQQSRKGSRKIRIELSRLVSSGCRFRIPVRWLLQRLAEMVRCLKVDLSRRCDGWQQEHLDSNIDEKLPLLASMS